MKYVARNTNVALKETPGIVTKLNVVCEGGILRVHRTIRERLILGRVQKRDKPQSNFAKD